MRPETINATQGIAVTRRASALPGIGTLRPADPQQAAPAAVPDPEVPAKPARRRFTANDKLRILRLADACTVPGSLGALLRREGLYSSNLTTWRRQRDAGTLSALTPRKRGRKAPARDPLRLENAQLRQENERLTRRLRQAELIMDVQKKVSQILGVPLATVEAGGSD
jgi:transposase-like protein